MMQTGIDLGEPGHFGPNQTGEVSGLFKQWLRDLPEPLVPSHAYEAAIMAARRRRSTINEGASDLQMDASSRRLAEALRSVMADALAITPMQRTTLRFVLHFLGRVAANNATNKMTAGNLGIVFAPNMIRTPMAPGVKDTIESQMAAISAMPFAIDVMRILIEYCDVVVPPPEGGDDHSDGSNRALCRALVRANSSRAAAGDGEEKGGREKGPGSILTEAVADMLVDDDGTDFKKHEEEEEETESESEDEDWVDKHEDDGGFGLAVAMADAETFAKAERALSHSWDE